MTPTQETLQPHLEMVQVFNEHTPTSHAWIAGGHRVRLAHYCKLLVRGCSIFHTFPSSLNCFAALTRPPVAGPRPRPRRT